MRAEANGFSEEWERKIAIGIQFASLGLLIVPLHDAASGESSCGDAQCPEPGRHPGVPLPDASRDPAVVEQWLPA